MRSRRVDSQYGDWTSDELWSGALLSGYQIRDCVRNAFTLPDRVHSPSRAVEDIVNASVLSQLQQPELGAFRAGAIRSRGPAPKSHHRDVEDLVNVDASEEDIRKCHSSWNSLLNGARPKLLIVHVREPHEALGGLAEGDRTLERSFRDFSQVEWPARLAQQTSRCPGESTRDVYLAAVRCIRSIQGNNPRVTSDDDCLRRIHSEDRRC